MRRSDEVDTAVASANANVREMVHPKARSWAPALAVSLITLAAVSIWFGFLDAGGNHPDLKIWLSMLIGVWGLGTVLFVRLLRLGQRTVLADVTGTALGLLSMATAVIHLAVVEQHLTLYWVYGWFFIVVGVAQLGWAIVVVLAPTKMVLWAGAIGNAIVAAAWVLTRTYGAVIGPDARTPDKVGFGDVVSTVFEVLIVVGAVSLLRSSGRVSADRSRTGDILSGFMALIVVAFTALSLYSAVGGSPFVSHVG
jgi:hypothetical protein